MTNNQKIIAIIILLLAITVRVFKFNQVPVSLYVDEVAMYIDAASVANLGTDMHGNPWWQTIYPSYGDYKQAAYIWLASAFMVVLGVHEWVLRLPSLLAGIGSVIVAGGLAYVLFAQNKKARVVIGLFSALVVAISPWSVMFSRVGFEGHLGQFFLATSLFFYIKSFKHRWYLIPTLLLAALSTYTYFSVRFVIPVIISAYYFLCVFPTQTFAAHKLLQLIKNILVAVVFPLLLYFILLMPLFSSQLYEPANTFRLSTESLLSTNIHVLLSNQYREITGSQFIDRIVFHRSVLFVKEFFINVSDHLSLNYLFISGDSNLRHGTGAHGVFLIGMFPFFIFGCYGLVKENKRVLSFIIIWWLVAVLPASIPESTPHTLRSLNAYMAVSLIIGYGLWYFFNSGIGFGIIKKITFVNQFLSLLLIGFLFISFVHFIHYYFVIYPIKSDNDWFSLTKKVALIVKDIRNEKKVYAVSVGDKYYLWLIAYAGYLGKSIPAKLYDGYIIKYSDMYHNDVDVYQLPEDGNIIVIVEGEVLAEEVRKIYQSKIIDSKTVKNMLGGSTYIFTIE